MDTNGFLDRGTFARVIAAEPRVPFAPEILARQVLNLLQGETDQPLYARVRGHLPDDLLEMNVKDLAHLMGPDITPAQAGRAVRKLGLRSMRARDGYHFFWNRAQLGILQEAVR